MKNMGVNAILNIFFGPVVNAANAISYQVNTAVMTLSSNFTTALNPQIMKAQSLQEQKRLESLLFLGGKLSFFLVMILSMPILIETPYILELWLDNYPEYTIGFIRLVLLLTLIESFNYTIGAAIQANGVIKKYQIYVSGISLFNLPICCVLFYFNFVPCIALLVSIIISLITLFIRIYFLEKYIHIKMIVYIIKVLLSCFITIVLSCIVPIIIHQLFHASFLRLLIVFIFSILSSMIIFYSICLDGETKFKIRFFLKHKFVK